MEITDVKVELVNDPKDRVVAFCSITLDREFVVNDIRLIKGAKGPFLAMPSKKLTDRCPRCRGKNHLQARYCNECGNRLADNRAIVENDKQRLHADVAHPISPPCRKKIQDAVMRAYGSKLEKLVIP